MHFLRAGVAQHAHQRLGGGASNNGVIDHDESLALDVLTQGIELAADRGVAIVLIRCDEGPSDVAVLNEPVAEGNPRGLGVALGGRHTAVGHTHDDVGGHVGLAREQLAHATARGVHLVSHEVGVGTREIDELEDAEFLLAQSGL